MATLYISYFGKVHDSCAGFPMGCEALTTSTTSAAASAAIPLGAEVFAVYSANDHYVCYDAVANTPTAAVGVPNGGTGASFFLPAGTTREIRLGAGHAANSAKIAAKSLT